MKRTLTLIALLLGSASTTAQDSPADLMPTYCKTPLQILSDGNEVSVEDVKEILAHTKSMKGNPARFLSDLYRMTPEDLFSLIQKSLAVRWKLPSMKNDELSSSSLPFFSDVREIFPHVTREMPLYRGFQQQTAEAHAFELSKLAASVLQEISGPSRRKQYFSRLLDQADRYGESWYHQTRVDQVLDRILDLRSQEVTELLQARAREGNTEGHQETYEAASASVLLTPYHEMRDIFHLPVLNLKPGMKVVDIGAGVGRLGIYLATKHPGVRFVGYEIVPERIREGQRAAKDLALGGEIRLIEQDLTQDGFRPEPADVYYAFNPVSGEAFDRILEDLRKVGLENNQDFKLILFGPAPFPKAEGQPWLRRLKGPGIPDGQEFGIFQFLPEEAARHKTIAGVGWRNIQGKKSAPAQVPEFPDSRPLAASDLKLIGEVQPSFSFVTPTFLSAWNQVEPLLISKINGTPLIQFSSGRDKGWSLEPFGPSIDRKVQAMDQVFEKKPRSGFVYITEPVVEALTPRKRYVVTQDPSISDYIYRLEDLTELKKTKKLRDRASQIKKFKQRFPKLITSEHMLPGTIQEIGHDFLNNWLTAKLLDATNHPKDSLERQQLDLAIQEGQNALKLDTNLGENGIRFALFNEGKILGYILAEVRPMELPGTTEQIARTALIYVQKTNGEPNAVVALNHEFMKFLTEHPERFGDVKYVNLMDDSGVAGLRRFKKAYSPLENVGRGFRVQTMDRE